MQLPLEYSAFVLGGNLPKLELLFRRTTVCNSHVAELLWETDHQISHLTKTRDEIAFALGNLTRADEDSKFQDCLALASNSCESLSARLVHFLKPDESAAPGSAIRGVPGTSDGGEASWRELSNSVDLIEDLSEELADQWDEITEQIEKRAGTLFDPLRSGRRVRTGTGIYPQPDVVAGRSKLGLIKNHLRSSGRSPLKARGNVFTLLAFTRFSKEFPHESGFCAAHRRRRFAAVGRGCLCSPRLRSDKHSVVDRGFRGRRLG